MKKKTLYIIVFILLSLTFSSCNKEKTIAEDDNETEDIVEKKEVVTLKTELNIPLTKVATLDPLKNNNFTYYNFSKLIYQPLFEFDDSLKIAPLLVQSYHIEDNGKTIEIELKDDIYWHNGDKLTTSDVEFTIKMLKELDGESLYKNIFTSALGSFNSFNIKYGINTQVIDDTKMKIIFNKSYGNSLETLTFPIVNSSSYSGEDEYKPIGTGPFTFLDYNSSQGITLSKNDNYWDGQVSVSKINGKIYANEDLMFKAFEDGRVDFAYGVGLELEKHKRNPNIKTLEYISPEYEFLGFNFRKKIFSGEKGKTLRKAIYYGIDRQEIIQTVYLGHATQVDLPIYPNSYLAEDVTNTYGYNKEKAQQLLKDIGFDKLGEDGLVKDRYGRGISLNLITNFSNKYRKQSAEIIKKNLEDIGVEVLLNNPNGNIDNADKEAIDREWDDLNRNIMSQNYDLAILGWELSPLTDLSFMFHSHFVKNGSNFINYKEWTMDKYLRDIYYSKPDEKQDIYKDLQEEIMESLPYSSLFFVNKALLLNGEIEGKFEPAFFNLYRGIEKCKIFETN